MQEPVQFDWTIWAKPPECYFTASTDKTSDTGSNMLNAFLMYLECQCGGIQGLKWPQSAAQFPPGRPLARAPYRGYPLRFPALHFFALAELAKVLNLQRVHYVCIRYVGL
jgi:hypothetical protein